MVDKPLNEHSIVKALFAVATAPIVSLTAATLEKNIAASVPVGGRACPLDAQNQRSLMAALRRLATVRAARAPYICSNCKAWSCIFSLARNVSMSSSEPLLVDDRDRSAFSTPLISLQLGGRSKPKPPT